MLSSVVHLLRDIASGGNASPAAREALLIPVDGQTTLARTRVQTSKLFDRLDKAFIEITKLHVKGMKATAAKEKQDAVARRAKAWSSRSGERASTEKFVFTLLGMGIGYALDEVSRYLKSRKVKEAPARPATPVKPAKPAAAPIKPAAAAQTKQDDTAGAEYKQISKHAKKINEVMHDGVSATYNAEMMGLEGIGGKFMAGNDDLVRSAETFAHGAKDVPDIGLDPKDSKIKATLISRVNTAIADFWLKAKGVVKDWLWSLFGGLVSTGGVAHAFSTPTQHPSATTPAATPGLTTPTAHAFTTPAATASPTTTNPVQPTPMSDAADKAARSAEWNAPSDPSGAIWNAPEVQPRQGGGQVTGGVPYKIGERGFETYSPRNTNVGSYMIGEHGPGLFVPPVSGVVTPHGASAPASTDALDKTARDAAWKDTTPSVAGSFDARAPASVQPNRMIEAISRSEGTSPAVGGKGYNSVFGNGLYGKSDRPLTSMTLQDVYDEGIERRKAQAMATNKRGEQVPWNKTSSAAGIGQLTGTTMMEQAKILGMDPKTTLFNEKTQDMLNTRAALHGGLGRWEGLKDNPQYMPEAKAGLKELRVAEKSGGLFGGSAQAAEAPAGKMGTSTGYSSAISSYYGIGGKPDDIKMQTVHGYNAPTAFNPASAAGRAQSPGVPTTSTPETAGIAQPFISTPASAASTYKQGGTGGRIEFTSNMPMPSPTPLSQQMKLDFAAGKMVGGYVQGWQGTTGPARMWSYATGQQSSPNGATPRVGAADWMGNRVGGTAPTTPGVGVSPGTGATPAVNAPTPFDTAQDKKYPGATAASGSTEMRANQTAPYITQMPTGDQPVGRGQPAGDTTGVASQAAQMQAAPEPDVQPAERPQSKQDQTQQGTNSGTGSVSSPINDAGSGGGGTEIFTNGNNRNTTMSSNTAGLVVMGNQYS